jgi:hypothetical protein
LISDNSKIKDEQTLLNELVNELEAERSTGVFISNKEIKELADALIPNDQGIFEEDENTRQEKVISILSGLIAESIQSTNHQDSELLEYELLTIDPNTGE